MTVYLRANVRGDLSAFRACAPVVVAHGPDAGASGCVAPPDRAPRVARASAAVILATGRMVVVPRRWLRGAP